MSTFLLMGWLFACNGPNEATLIAELRVVAAVAEPPQVNIGQPYTLTATIADPEELGGDWSIWTCIPAPEDLELPPGLEDLELPELEPGCIATNGVLEGEEVQAELIGLPFPTYVMACNPGRCDLPGITEEQRQDPDPWLQELPFSGVALGRRFPSLIDPANPPEEPPANPVVEEVSGLEEVVKPEAEMPLSFVVPGAERAYGYATAGGFQMTEYDVGREGNTELVWVAPEEAAEVRLYIVFLDGEGGTVVWKGDLSVE